MCFVYIISISKLMMTISTFRNIFVHCLHFGSFVSLIVIPHITLIFSLFLFLFDFCSHLTSSHYHHTIIVKYTQYHSFCLLSPTNNQSDPIPLNTPTKQKRFVIFLFFTQMIFFLFEIKIKYKYYTQINTN